MAEQRDRWSSRTGFVLAAVGSAVGLGNLWRFPFVAYENGGGAFLLPYFVALLTTGIPLMILEYSLGHKMQAGAAETFRRIHKNLEWLGWTQAVMMLVVAFYYAVVMAWSWVYLYEAWGLGWGDDAQTFFHKDVLGLTDGPMTLGSLGWPLVIGLILTWISIYLIINKGVTVVGKVVLFTVPLPLFFMVVFLIRGVTLDGATDGLEFFLAPQWEKLLDPTVWLAAYGQIFYSLSLAFGVLIAYASFLPEDSDVTNNAFITSLANCGTSFMAGLAVFSVIGFLALEQGQPIAEVMKSGPGLAFVTYPTIISKLPFAPVFAVLFFVMLLTLGIDSAFSIVEGTATAIRDRWHLGKRRVVGGLCVLGFMGGLLFATGAGLYWLDIVDHFLTNIALPVVGMMECLAVGLFFGAEKLRAHANEVSDFAIGRWWSFCAVVLTPVLLMVMFVTYLLKRIAEPYEGYPQIALWLGGWGSVALFFGAGFALMVVSRRRGLPNPGRQG